MVLTAFFRCKLAQTNKQIIAYKTANCKKKTLAS